jgi:hypothetical protein
MNAFHLVALLAFLPAWLGAQSFESIYPAPDLPCAGSIVQEYPFSDTLPTSLFIYNRDTGTLASGVSLNKGWQIQQDASTPPNYFLSAPSWYSNSVQADNLLCFQTPQLPNQTCLSFQAWSEDPLYLETIEIWISGTGPLSDSVLAGNLLLSESVPAFPTYFSVDLSAWAGQQVWIGIRHHSANKFIISLDNIRLTDASLNTLEFASAGLSRKPTLGDTLQLKAWLVNRGTVPFTSGQLKWTRMENSIPADSALHPYGGPALGLNESELITFPENWTPTQTGMVQFRIELIPNSTDTISYQFSESVDFTVSTPAEVNADTVKLFPIPATTFIEILSNSPWEIYSFTGVKIRSGEGSREALRIEVSEWSRGMYIVKTGPNADIVKKFIIHTPY